MSALIINLFGGPCSGKSTIASGIFYELKCLGVNCEIVTEVSKDEIWNGSSHLLENQPYIFGNQLHRIWRLNDKVDVIVSDSPILLSIVYSRENSKNFDDHIVEVHNRFDNLNFFITRNNHRQGFENIGRVHSEKESKTKDKEIREMLSNYKIKYDEIKGIDSHDIVRQILPKIRAELFHRENS